MTYKLTGNDGKIIYVQTDSNIEIEQMGQAKGLSRYATVWVDLLGYTIPPAQKVECMNLPIKVETL